MEHKKKQKSESPISPESLNEHTEYSGPVNWQLADIMPAGLDEDLRHKAELLALNRESEQANMCPLRNGSERSTLHELLVHQIELEIQNEELRAAQVKVEEAKARYFELYELAPVGYIVLTQQGVIMEANITAGGILGLAKYEILNQPFTRFIVGEDQDLYHVRNRKLFSTREPQILELRINRADRQVRWVQLTETVSKSADGVVCRMVMSDITDRKIAEDLAFRSEQKAIALVRKLQRADQNKNKFLNVLSHELRNPLAAIVMGLSLQKLAPPGSDTAIRAGEALERQAGQLTHLVDDLLDIARISQNKITLKKKPLELVELTQRVVLDFQPAFAAKGVTLETNCPEMPIWLEADSVRLIQVIGNLLHNALKFSVAGSIVFVTLSVDGKADGPLEAVLRVSDYGVGMDEELQQDLFQPFMQADNSLNRGMGGLGLGLAVVKGMIEMHGGHVEAASEGIGKGSQFTIRLPLVNDETAGVPQKPAGISAPARSLRILVIEDNADLQQIIVELLQLLGHETAAAGTGTEGVSRFDTYHPDVVICDIGLPGMSGYEVARTLNRGGDRKRPFLIALSGYAQPEDVDRAMAAGFDRHLTKPVDLSDLKQLLSDPERTSVIAR